MASGQIRKVTSFGLIITFLASALALPIVSSPIEKEFRVFTLKASSDLAGGNVQLPLAEKENENEEEESGCKRDQTLIAEFVNEPIEQLLATHIQVQYYSSGIKCEFKNSLPLYLSKRHLII